MTSFGGTDCSKIDRRESLSKLPARLRVGMTIDSEISFGLLITIAKSTYSLLKLIY
jgi:hypothetical protein